MIHHRTALLYLASLPVVYVWIVVVAVETVDVLAINAGVESSVHLFHSSSFFPLFGCFLAGRLIGRFGIVITAMAIAGRALRNFFRRQVGRSVHPFFGGG